MFIYYLMLYGSFFMIPIIGLYAYHSSFREPLMALSPFMLVLTSIYRLVIGGVKFNDADKRFFLGFIVFTFGALCALFHGSGDLVPGSYYSFGLLWLLIIASRILWKDINLLLACRLFSLGGLVILGILWKTGQFDLSMMMEGTAGRLTSEDLHPNLLAFCCLCFSVGVFAFAYSQKIVFRAISVVLFIVYTYTLFRIGSRGSLLAYVLAFIIVTGLVCYRYTLTVKLKPAVDGWFRTFESRITFLTLIAVLSTILISALFWNEAFRSKIYDGLELGSQYRGLDSGLSGRTATWEYIYSSFNFIESSIGYGMRSPLIQALVVDNGYIVVYLELGLIAFLWFSFIWFGNLQSGLKILKVSCYRINPAVYSFLFVILAVLINSSVARYLVSVGNPGGVFFIFLMVAPLDEFIKNKLYRVDCPSGLSVRI